MISAETLQVVHIAISGLILPLIYYIKRIDTKITILETKTEYQNDFNKKIESRIERLELKTRVKAA